MTHEDALKMIALLEELHRDMLCWHIYCGGMLVLIVWNTSRKKPGRGREGAD